MTVMENARHVLQVAEELALNARGSCVGLGLVEAVDALEAKAKALLLHLDRGNIGFARMDVRAVMHLLVDVLAEIEDDLRVDAESAREMTDWVDEIWRSARGVYAALWRR